MDPALAHLGEFGLIGLIRQRIQERTAGTIRGIGDDAAVLAPDPGTALLVTTDMLLEGIHFQSGWGLPRELGRKALAVNVSDIAAMGGRPLHALLGLAIPLGGIGLAELETLLLGFEEEAAAHGVTLVGGDTCASASGLVLSVTLLGRAPREGPVLRSGAKPGDSLWVTGTLGGSAAGLLALERGFRPGQGWPAGLARPDWLGQQEAAAIQAALAAHLTPVPRVAAGQALAGKATAMIDVSDGIASDAGHLCTESGVAVRLQASRIPVHPGTSVLARLFGQEALDLALRGGEDYELLFATGLDPVRCLAEAAPALPVTCIGEVIAGPPVLTLVHSQDREEILTGGFDHFTGLHPHGASGG
ncbi:MAG TPA: thiamine-phosphate kinase [Candidatus Acidoferrum sp.]|nr:thiamine-phosphate kinase [Candidatus Acidoferrum sp.]